MAEQVVSVRIEITSGGSVRVLQDVSGAMAGIGTAAQQATTQVEGELGKMAGLFGGVTEKILGMGTSMGVVGAAAAALGAAFSFVGGLAALKAMAEQSINLADSLEQSTIAIAATLQATTELRDASGQLLAPAQAWTQNLGEAAKLQERILDLNAQTLGSAKDLRDVYQAVATFSRGQVATQEQLLTLSQGVLNVGKLQGLSGEMLVAEVRQMFELNSAMGQRILPAIHITNLEDARTWKQKGDYVQELITRMEVYKTLADASSQSFDAIKSTVESFTQALQAQTFGGVFSAFKELLIGAGDELKRLKQEGSNIPVNVNTEDLRKAGAILADIFDWIVKISAKTVAVVVEVGTNAANLPSEIGLTQGFVKDLQGALGETTLKLLQGAAEGAKGAWDLAKAGVLGAGAAVNFTYAELLRLNTETQKADDVSRTAWSQAERGLGLVASALVGSTKQAHEFTFALVSLGDAFNALGGIFFRTNQQLQLSTDQLKGIADATIHVLQLRRDLAAQAATITPGADVGGVLAQSLALIDAQTKQKFDLKTTAEQGVEITKAGELEKAQAYAQTADIFIANKRVEVKAEQEAAAARVAITTATSQQVIGGLQAEVATITNRIAVLALERDTETQRASLAQQKLTLEQQIARTQGDAARAQATATQQDIGLQQQQLAALRAKRAEAQAQVATTPERGLEVSKYDREITDLSAKIETERAKVIQFSTTATTEFAKIGALKAKADTDFFKALSDQAAAQAKEAKEAADAAEVTARAQQATLQNKDQLLAAQENRAQANLTLLKAEGASIEVVGEQLRVVLDLEKQRAQNELAIAQATLANAQVILAGLDSQIAKNTALIATSKARGVELDALITKQHTLNIEQSGATQSVIAAQNAVEVATEKVATAATNGQIAWSQYNQELTRTASLTKNDVGNALEQIATGLLQGTQSLGNSLADLGKGLGVKLFKGILVGKNENLDVPLIGNINSLLGGNQGGILGSIFGNGGGIAANLFGGALTGGISQTLGSGFGAEVANVFDANSTVWNLAGGAASSWFGNSLLGGLTSQLTSIFPSLGGLMGSLAPLLTNPITAAFAILGTVLFSLKDILFQPGRIATEKQSITKYFEQIFDGIDFKTFKEKQVAAAFVTGKDLDASSLTLGALYAKEAGEGSTQGTIVRTGGQLLANLFDKQGLSAEQAKNKVLEAAHAMKFDLVESLTAVNGLMGQFSEHQGNNLLSLEQFRKELGDAQRNLSKYGETAGLTAKQLSEMAVAHGNTGSKIVLYTDLVAGAIDIASGFNAAVNAQSIALKLASQQFAETAIAQGSAGDAATTLAQQVKDGSVSLEEAIIQLNKFREAAGLAALSMTDFQIDPAKVEAEIQKIISLTQNLATFFEDVGKGLGESITKGISSPEVGLQFENALRSQLGAAIAGAFVTSLQETLSGSGIKDFLADFAKLVSDFGTGTITQATFESQFAALKDKYGPTIQDFKQKIMDANTAGQELLGTFGLLPDEMEKAKKKADELVDKIHGIVTAINDVVAKQFQLRIDVAGQLGSIGALSGTDAAKMKQQLLQGQFDTIDIHQSYGHVTGLQNLTDDMVAREITILGAQRDAAVGRYQAEADAINTALQKEIDAINKNATVRQDAIKADFDARKDALKDEADQLQETKDRAQDLYSAQLESLKTLLQVAQDFAGAAKDAQKASDSLVTGANSALSKPEQALFLQQQEALIRNQLGSAARGDRPELIRSLVENLQLQLTSSPYQISSLDYFRKFTATIQQIAELQTAAQVEADRIPDLTNRILDTQLAQKLYVASIDAQIKQAHVENQALSKALSAEEKAATKAAADAAAAAVVAAQDRAKTEIAGVSARIASEIVTLGSLETILLGEQQKRLLEQKAVAEAQLVEMVGADQAAKLLASGNDAQIVLLAGVQQALVSIDNHLLTFLQGGTVTGGGSVVTTSENPGEGRDVPGLLTRTPPVRDTRAYSYGTDVFGQPTAVHINVPNVTVNTNGTPEDAAAAGHVVWKQIRDNAVQEIEQRGPLAVAVTRLTQGK